MSLKRINNKVSLNKSNDKGSIITPSNNQINNSNDKSDENMEDINNENTNNSIIDDNNNDDNEDNDNEDNDNDDNEDDNINEDDDNINEDDDNTENNTNKDDENNKNKKEKPKKYNLKELISLIDIQLEIQSNSDNIISELTKELIKQVKISTTCRKNIEKLNKLMPKAHDDDINKVRKEKKKRKSNIKSGILAEIPVPQILLNYLDLPESSILSRTTVFSLLNKKFSQLKLKNGQETILDKDNAKIFDVPEGYVIKFEQFQTFLANIYEKANIKTNEVIL